MVECKNDEIINPATGRCVKKTGKIGRKLLGTDGPKPCKSYQIRNPETGRCVEKTGPIGKRLLRKNLPPKLNKAFDPKYILNPETGRYVKRDGEIGQRLVLKTRELNLERLQLEIPDTEQISSQNIIRERTRGRKMMNFIMDERTIRQRFGPPIFDTIPSGYVVAQRIGEQSRYGEIYLLCEKDALYSRNCDLVMKVQIRNRKESKTSEMFRNRMNREFEMQKRFAQVGLAPRAFMRSFYSYKNQDYFVIIMERVDAVLSQSLREFPKGQEVEDYCELVTTGVYNLLLDMSRHNLVHGDFHTGNIGIRLEITGEDTDEEYQEDMSEGEGEYVYRFVIIDFGWASIGPKHGDMELDLLQYLGSILGSKSIPRLRFENNALYKCMVDRTVALWNELFPNSDLPMEAKDVIQHFLKLHALYVKHHYFRNPL